MRTAIVLPVVAYLTVAYLTAACRCPAPAPPPMAACPAGASVEATAADAAPPAPGAGPASLAEGSLEPVEPLGAGAGAAPEAVPVAGPPAESLPEVKIRNVGMHVGGGPNDAAAKAPFQDAIAVRFPDFQRCYAHISEPGKGGVFGVDLRIPREGGPPTIQGSRTALGGATFRECVLEAFSRVEFARPPRGPTVISYSLEFSVGGG